MSSDKEKKLQLALEGIQRRWGNRAIGLAKRQSASIPHISTGFPALDEKLGIGGIPRGRISEILGAPTSGAVTMAMKIIANAQARQGAAVYLDLEQTFDPDYAAYCGVNPRQIILVHPYNGQQALAMLPDFIANGGMEMIVCDMPLRLQMEPHIMQAISTSLGRLIAPLSRSGCVLLFITTLFSGSTPSLDAYPKHAPLPYYATIRLLIQKERWLYRRRDICGYEAQVLIAKNKLGPAGQKAGIAISFNDFGDKDYR